MSNEKIDLDEELLQSFLEESRDVLVNLHEFLSNFKRAEDRHLFEQFGQQVDRIMGAAYTLSLKEIGDLAKLGKEIGYKSSQVKDFEKLLSIQSLLSQLVSAIERSLKALRKGRMPEVEEHLKERLNKANLQLGNLRKTAAG